MNEKNLATEILTELKHTCNRWKIAFFAMIAIELATLLLFFLSAGGVLNAV